jgi:hypothetical protein
VFLGADEGTRVDRDKEAALTPLAESDALAGVAPWEASTSPPHSMPPDLDFVGVIARDACDALVDDIRGEGWDDVKSEGTKGRPAGERRQACVR